MWEKKFLVEDCIMLEGVKYIQVTQLRKLESIIQKWWISSKTVGIIKRKIYAILQKKYAFGDWHLEPINFRPYAQEVVFVLDEYVSKKPIKCVVEVGCGLGDVIGNIKTIPEKPCEKIGIDRSENVLKGAKFLNPSTTFLKGSFEKCINKDHVCLIMMNFIHTIPEEKLKAEVQYLLLKNNVSLVIMDTFKRNKNTEYVYSHKGEYLLGGVQTH